MERRCGEGAKGSAERFGSDENQQGFSVTAEKASSQNQTLNLCPFHMYGLKSMAPLDTGVTPNFISTSLLKNIGVRAEATNKGITVRSGDHVNCKVVIQGVPVFVDNLITTMVFLAVEEVPVNLLISINALKRLQTNLDHIGQLAEFETKEEEVRVSLQLITSCFYEEQVNNSTNTLQ